MIIDGEPWSFLLAALAESSRRDNSKVVVQDSSEIEALDDSNIKALEELSKRLARLEARHTAEARRALRDAKSSCASWRRRWVAPDYYSRTMGARAALLQCKVEQMCKSMLLENKLWKGEDEFARDNARHYIVVVQYAASLSTAKLREGLADLSGLTKSQYNFRVASPEDNERLTGFEHGAVTPFGAVDTRVPVVLAQAASQKSFIWLGGGHPELKMGCSVLDFVERFNPLVLDASEPRDLSADDVPQINKPSAVDGAADDADEAASRLALVVGRIVDAWQHPDSDKLFCEKIDCGSFGLREIASGLRAHYDERALKDRLVIVVANLKPRKLAGFTSQGMVLCATAGQKVLFVDPPQTAQPGDRVVFPGLSKEPATEKQCDKGKLFKKAQPHFNVQATTVFYKDKPFEIPERGVCAAPIDDGAGIS